MEEIGEDFDVRSEINENDANEDRNLDLDQNADGDADGEGISSEEMIKRFPPPPKRLCPWNEKPTYKNGQCIPRQDALLMEMVISEKATLKAQLDITKKAIVGLDFVTEYIDPDGISPRIYHCSLCNTFRTVSTVMEHITGYNHRVNYIRKQFPAEVKQYLLPNGMQKNRNSGLMMVASKRCNELELVYGRGDFIVKNEKVKIPEGELDAPEKEGGTGPQNEGKQLEYLQTLLRDVKKIKLQSDEEARIAKQIITVLTDSICDHKFSGQKK